MVDTLSQQCVDTNTGVCPQGAQVRVTVGFKLKPTSSMKTNVSPASTFFSNSGTMVSI